MALVNRGKGLMALSLVDAHSLVCVLVVHARIQSKIARRELGKRLLLRNQSRGNVGAVPRADVRLVVIQIELSELHHLLEERGVLLGVQQWRGVVMVEAVVVSQVRRRLCRRHV